MGTKELSIEALLHEQKKLYWYYNDEYIKN